MRNKYWRSLWRSQIVIDLSVVLDCQTYSRCPRLRYYSIRFYWSGSGSGLQFQFRDSRYHIFSYKMPGILCLDSDPGRRQRQQPGNYGHEIQIHWESGVVWPRADAPSQSRRYALVLSIMGNDGSCDRGSTEISLMSCPNSNRSEFCMLWNQENKKGDTLPLWYAGSHCGDSFWRQP